MLSTSGGLQVIYYLNCYEHLCTRFNCVTSCADLPTSFCRRTNIFVCSYLSVLNVIISVLMYYITTCYTILFCAMLYVSGTIALIEHKCVHGSNPESSMAEE